jgi:hypothetical protein
MSEITHKEKVSSGDYIVYNMDCLLGIMVETNYKKESAITIFRWCRRRHILWNVNTHLLNYIVPHDLLFTQRTSCLRRQQEFTPQCQNKVFLSLFILLYTVFSSRLITYIQSWSFSSFGYMKLLFQNTVLNFYEVSADKTQIFWSIKFHKNVKLISNHNTFTASIRKVYVLCQDMSLK